MFGLIDRTPVQLKLAFSFVQLRLEVFLNVENDSAVGLQYIQVCRFWWKNMMVCAVLASQLETAFGKNITAVIRSNRAQYSTVESYETKQKAVGNVMCVLGCSLFCLDLLLVSMLSFSSVSVWVFVKLQKIKSCFGWKEISLKFSLAFKCIHPTTQPVNPQNVAAANIMDQSVCLAAAWWCAECSGTTVWSVTDLKNVWKPILALSFSHYNPVMLTHLNT